MITTATRNGDEWVLNGSKMFISSSSYAGVFVVWAVTDPTLPKGKGISLFLVEGQADGLIIGKKRGKNGAARLGDE